MVDGESYGNGVQVPPGAGLVHQPFHPPLLGHKLRCAVSQPCQDVLPFIGSPGLLFVWGPPWSSFNWIPVPQSFAHAVLLIYLGTLLGIHFLMHIQALGPGRSRCGTAAPQVLAQVAARGGGTDVATAKRKALEAAGGPGATQSTNRSPSHHLVSHCLAPVLWLVV